MKAKVGGGVCRWEDNSSYPPSIGTINVYTGEGTYTDRLMPGQKGKIFTIKDFKVISVAPEP